MNKSPSVRWLRAGVAMFGCGAVMYLGSVITGLAHGPRLASGILLALMPFCALAGFAIFGVGATKATRENRQLRIQAIAKARTAVQARRDRATRYSD